jgi:hypothetical protein
MGRMIRTQITLKEDEYVFLKAEAADKNQSLSSVVRDLVRAEMLNDHRPVLHIWELAGLLPPSGAPGEIDYSGRDHDKVIADAIAAEMGLDPGGPQ